MCNIDKQLEGTLPAYVFSLLAICYLQQCTPPVLPVLHEVPTAVTFLPFIFLNSNHILMSFSALTLLVGQQEGYPVCKN